MKVEPVIINVYKTVKFAEYKVVIGRKRAPDAQLLMCDLFVSAKFLV